MFLHGILRSLLISLMVSSLPSSSLTALSFSQTVQLLQGPLLQFLEPSFSDLYQSSLMESQASKSSASSSSYSSFILEESLQSFTSRSSFKDSQFDYSLSSSRLDISAILSSPYSIILSYFWKWLSLSFGFFQRDKERTRLAMASGWHQRLTRFCNLLFWREQEAAQEVREFWKMLYLVSNIYREI